MPDSEPGGDYSREAYDAAEREAAEAKREIHNCVITRDADIRSRPRMMLPVLTPVDIMKEPTMQKIYNTINGIGETENGNQA